MMSVRKLSSAASKGILIKLSSALLLSQLTACGNSDFSDLNRYILSVKSRPKGSIEKLPEVKTIDPFVYKTDVLRDPFKPVEHPEQQQGIGTAIGNGLRPDFQRRKEELEAFPLDALKMVGTVVMKSKLWGLVKATDGTIHRVQVGNYMGKNFGKIIRIGTDKIELTEIVPDKPGTWREQQTLIALTE